MGRYAGTPAAVRLLPPACRRDTPRDSPQRQYRHIGIHHSARRCSRDARLGRAGAADAEHRGARRHNALCAIRRLGGAREHAGRRAVASVLRRLPRAATQSSGTVKTF